MGLTPHQYAAGKRLNQFKRHVKSGADLTSALYAAGYSSTSRLYEGVSERMGMTPAVYRQGGAGKKIHYAMIHTYLGVLLAAAARPTDVREVDVLILLVHEKEETHAAQKL